VEDFDAFYIGTLLLPVLLLVGLRLLKRFRATASGAGMVIGWNALLLGFLLSVILLGGETYYRFFVDTTDTFSINKVSQRWFDRYYAYNNFNTRDNIAYRAERDKRKHRITFLGDSFTAGHGIEQVEARMGNMIRAMHPEWEVHVMALNGIESNTQTDFMGKMARADGYEFDVVVLGYCLNDILWLTPGLDEIYDKIYDYAENLNWLERNSYFVNTLAFRFLALRDPVFGSYMDKLEATYTGDTWLQQQQMLLQLRDFMRTQNARLLVVTWPLLGEFGAAGYRLEHVHEQLGQFWQQAGVPHLDLLPTLAPHAREALVVNPYDGHPNEFANQLATDVVNEFLLRELGTSR